VGDLLAVVAVDDNEYQNVSVQSVPRSSAPAAPETGSAVVEAMPIPDDATVTTRGADTKATDRQAHRREMAENRAGPLASPVARRLAARHDVSLDRVRASGSRGVIRKRDVERVLDRGTERHAAPVTRRNEGHKAPGAGTTRTLTPMRRTIATRMHRSVQESAQMTDVREHEVTRLVEMRDAAKLRADDLGFRISYTDFLVKATALALRAVPELNAQLDGDNLTVFENIDIGVAVAVPDGLVVPVVRGADRRSLRVVHEQIEGLVTRARDRRLTPEEMSGGTFTLTNFGSYGSHFGTPILTPGQVGTLGAGALLERPVVRDGGLAVGVVMHTSLTVDHRVVDGESAGRFQNAIGELLTDPERLLYG
jgi:pyruvate/2-oxoglutarate dehydrogenase complex dihydrolipoamide acyltransferase (E2) component